MLGRDRRLALGMIAALLTCLLGAVPQTALGAEVPFLGGFPETSPQRIFPLSQIKRGQRGIGYTVFAADTPEPFDVEVLGVMEGMLGPGRSVILARLSGEKIAFTGVIAGMSGSPVYIDGRLVGAVAYRFGSFTKEPIAGITPIEDMLDAFGPEIAPSALSQNTTPPLARGTWSVGRFRSRELLPPLPLPHLAEASPQGVKAIATPLFMSGISPEVFAQGRPALEAAGFMPVAGGGSGPKMELGLFQPRPSGDRTVEANVAGEAGRVAASPIAPASAIAALLMRGDINVAAVGTVTWVQGTRVLAFGHPFIGHGKVAFPMATAAIINTLASEAGSYKQGLAAKEVGIITQDRLTAIGGDLGQAAPMVPVRILVQRQDEPRGSPGLETRVEIVDDPIWLPNMLENAIASAASRRLGYEAGGTLSVSTRIQTPKHTVAFHDMISAPPPLRLAAFVARDVATTASMMLSNELQPAQIEGIEVILRVSPQVQLLELERIIAPTRAHPNERITVQAVLRPYRQGSITVPIEITVPADAEGEFEVFVGGGVELDQKDGQARGRRTPQTLEDLMALLSSRRPAQALYARIYQPQPGLTQNMALLSALPASQRAVLLAQAMPGLDEGALHPGPEVAVARPEVVAGSRSVTIRVTR